MPARHTGATLSVLVITGRRPAAPQLACYLTGQGVHVTTVADSAQGQVEVRARHYDCVVVDLESPAEAVIVSSALKAGCSVPILVIAATDAARARISTLDAGADICTALGLRDLFACILAVVRRVPANET